MLAKIEANTADAQAGAYFRPALSPRGGWFIYLDHRIFSFFGG
jgi:hypothetical protein